MKGVRSSTYGKKKIKRPSDKLSQLVKNGRDYSKTTLNEQLTAARESLGRNKPKIWMKIVSVPTGGLNKKY